MTAIVVHSQENRALLATAVESKLTRTELLDLVVDRVKQELTAEIDKLETQRKALKTELPPSAALKMLSKYRDNFVSVEISSGWGRDEGHRALKMKVSLPLDAEFPKSYVEANKKNEELTARIRDLERERRRLLDGKTRARVEMLKQALESTPEGARIYQAISELGVTLRAKLTSTVTPA